MSRCQDSQSNSQEWQKAAQASKIELKPKRSREKGNELRLRRHSVHSVLLTQTLDRLVRSVVGFSAAKLP